MKKYACTILPIFLIILFSCSEMTGEFKYMIQLKKAISEKYESDKIDINIKNNNELIVSLIDPKFDDYTATKKEQIALEIGKLAQELSEDKETIKSGTVSFQDEKNYGIAKISSAETFPMYK